MVGRPPRQLGPPYMSGGTDLRHGWEDPSSYALYITLYEPYASKARHRPVSNGTDVGVHRADPSVLHSVDEHRVHEAALRIKVRAEHVACLKSALQERCDVAEVCPGHLQSQFRSDHWYLRRRCDATRGVLLPSSNQILLPECSPPTCASTRDHDSSTAAQQLLTRVWRTIGGILRPGMGLLLSRS